jgi:hypothetical protein
MRIIRMIRLFKLRGLVNRVSEFYSSFWFFSLKKFSSMTVSQRSCLYWKSSLWFSI